MTVWRWIALLIFIGASTDILTTSHPISLAWPFEVLLVGVYVIAITVALAARSGRGEAQKSGGGS
jgi:hypothetical protein